ncbi:methyltransferase [Neobacillus mesonae]|uniref:methyltransferase n=1 Tax=Neobacillus mesonae TaxID=1193713 RepID=UPI00203A7530|nr:methyltransferase [Neobacillus mesonae]MCM3568602.1 SAM-dependent methyltransferase [Neobacillus mesonae]
MKEHYYDRLLNINTRGDRLEGPAQKPLRYYPYEPTPYSALELLFEEYEVNKTDHVVDFGCGKGRLNFYLHYFFQASVTGIEMNETLYKAALENSKSYRRITKKRLDRIRFYCCLAEEYKIDPLDNRFYFFNPFSIQIFRSIINHIVISFENTERDIELILYYPSDDYIYFLEKETAFECKKEIILPHDYLRDAKERFLIYRLV